MVSAAQDSDELIRRNKMREALYERGMKYLREHDSMPTISEDKAKDEWVNQDVKHDGIVTVAQKIMTGVSSKDLTTFGYEIE